MEQESSNLKNIQEVLQIQTGESRIRHKATTFSTLATDQGDTCTASDRAKGSLMIKLLLKMVRQIGNSGIWCTPGGVYWNTISFALIFI